MSNLSNFEMGFFFFACSQFSTLVRNISCSAHIIAIKGTHEIDSINSLLRPLHNLIHFLCLQRHAVTTIILAEDLFSCVLTRKVFFSLHCKAVFCQGATKFLQGKHVFV